MDEPGCGSLLSLAVTDVFNIAEGLNITVSCAEIHPFETVEREAAGAAAMRPELRPPFDLDLRARLVADFCKSWGSPQSGNRKWRRSGAGSRPSSSSAALGATDEAEARAVGNREGILARAAAIRSNEGAARNVGRGRP